MPKYTIDLTKLDSLDGDRFSETFSRLSFLKNSGIQSSPGFVIGFEAFEDSLWPLLPQVTKVLATTSNHPDRTAALKSLQKSISAHILLPNTLSDELKHQLKNLKSPFLVTAVVVSGSKKETVSFESSATNFTEVSKTVISSWLSFLNKGIFEKRESEDLEKTNVAICITQKNLVEVSGKAFILSGQEDSIEIQSQWGEYNPVQKSDSATLSRKTLEEKGYLIAPQKTQLVFSKGKYLNIAIPEKFQNERKLNPDQALTIGQALKKIQSLALTSVELSFEIIDHKIYSNEIKFNTERGKKNESFHIGIDLPQIEALRPLVPGIAAGIGKFINKPADLRKLKLGDIAIVNSFKKEYLPTLKKASGLIIQNSKKFSNESLPLVNSLGIATVFGNIKKLQNQVITLDGKTGKVYKGAFGPFSSNRIEVSNPPEPNPKIVKTATKIFATINSNSKALKIDEIDGVGPVRPEIFFTHWGIHPWHLAKKSKLNQVVSEISLHLEQIANLASDKPIIYQVSDFRTNELIHLNFGEIYEKPETNPLLGFRGTARHLTNPIILEEEFRMIKELRGKMGFKNIWISLPFLRTIDEFKSIKRLIATQGLQRSPTFKLLLTISNPANIISVEDFMNEGVDGFLVDYYDLANLTYGKDFSYQELSQLNDSAIEISLENLFKQASKAKLFTGIFNLPPENSKLLKKLVPFGVASVSVSSDLISQTRSSISEAEKQLVKDK